MYKEILVSETAKILTGKELLPPLRVQEKTLTATEIADIFDITPNKEVESNFKNAREYEIEQMLEKIEEDYSNYIRKSF